MFVNNYDVFASERYWVPSFMLIAYFNED